MKYSLAVCLLLAVPVFGEHETPTTGTGAQQRPEASRILHTVRHTSGKIIEDYHAELEAKNRSVGGCLWTAQDHATAARNPTYAQHMATICEAEKRALEVANADRKQYCSEPLIWEPRLSFISRQNAIAYLNEGGAAHKRWYDGTVQGWLRDWFPAANRVMAFDKENYAGGDGQPLDKTSLPAFIVGMWIGSGGHHAPIIDCSNRYAGIGIQYNPATRHWVSYMSFAKLRELKD